MQIQISWFLQKPTDLDLHCLQRQGISGFSRTRVKIKLNVFFCSFSLWVDGFICGICCVIICSSSLLLVPWEGCTSWLWHFLGMTLTLWQWEKGLNIKIYLMLLDQYLTQFKVPISALFIHITKTCPYNVDPLKPHFYIVKLGFTGVYIIFHISAQNIDCGYSLELPWRGGSNEYPQSMFLSRHKKNIRIFIWNISYFAGKFSSIFE